MADEAERIRFQDLVFLDKTGKPLPLTRPVRVFRTAHGMLHFRVETVGNGHDLWRTVMCHEGIDLGPGLRKAWVKLHPLLG